MTFKPPSDTFCALPWMHLSTRPSGMLRLCCTANASSVGPTNDKEHGGQVGIVKMADGKPANLNTTTLLEAWNNDYMKNVRTQMLAGHKPASCLKCYKEEEQGHASKRQWETQYWSNRVDLQSLIDETSPEGQVEPRIQYVDLRLGSKCQLACVMCSPADSSGWIKDWKALHPQVTNPHLKETTQWEAKEGHMHGASYNWHKNNPVFWEQLYDQIPNMRQLYFAGGEATIIEEHYTLLEEVIRRGHAKTIELRYNSNAVEMPERLFELWSHFERVRFHYSIDSIGAMNDYIRHPSQWDHQVAMFHILDNTGPNVEVTVACAVQALNIHYIPDLIRWKLEQGFKKINPWPLGAGLVNFHHVYHPPHLNCRVLPKWFKDETEAKYETFYIWLEENWHLCAGVTNTDFETWRNAPYGIKRLQGLIKFMQSEDWSQRQPEMIEYLNLIDKIRGQNASEIFPEMADVFAGRSE
jgi:hypothetical protein